MTIKEAQEAVDKWIKEYGVRYFSELTNMACLTEEVGELARVIARTYGDQSFKKGEKPNLGAASGPTLLPIRSGSSAAIIMTSIFLYSYLFSFFTFPITVSISSG